MGEIDGVLQEVAKAVEDRGIAPAGGFVGDRPADERDIDRDAEVAVRRHHLLDQRGELDAVERIAAARAR